MANRPFEDFTEDEIKDMVERFIIANGFEHAPSHGEWPHNGGKEQKCRLREDADKSKEGSATAYLKLDAPQRCIIYSHRRGRLEWKIEEEQREHPEQFRGDGASFAGGYHKPTPEEEAQRDRERAAQKAAAEAEAAREFEKVRLDTLRSYQDEANEIAPYGAIGPGIEYLKRKGVPAFPGVKLSWQPWKIFPVGSLVIPFYDVLTDKFITLQRIKPDGKGFASGFGGHAAAFWILPDNKTDQGEAPSAPRRAPVVILCEGYATGATCAQLFGLPVGVTGDRGKMKNTAAAILNAASWSSVRLLIAGDDDTAKTADFLKAAGKAPGKGNAQNPGKETTIQIFNLNRRRVYPVPAPWDWKGRDLDAVKRGDERARSDWNDFATFYPDEARDAARAALERAKAYFQKQTIKGRL